MEMVISSQPVRMSVTAEGVKHTLTVHETALTQIPYFKESSWCAGKTDLDITLPAGTGIEAMQFLLTRCYGLQLSKPSTTLACQTFLLSEFFLMHEDRAAILDLLKRTLVSQQALDEARQCFREKEVPQELQHILSNVATSVDSLVLDVAQWGEASVKAMLQTCLDSLSTAPADLDDAKPRKSADASSLFHEKEGYQRSWFALSPEEKKKWESQAEALQKKFLDLEKSWKERRQIQAKHFEKVREIFDRRSSRGLVKTDISILMNMLVGPAATRVRAYFSRDERVKTGKAASSEGEFEWKIWKYSLQLGFESLSAVASALIAAHPDFWAVFVFDLVAGLPFEVQAQTRKNADGSFTFTTVGVELAEGFWRRLAKVLEAAVDLGMRLLKERKLQPVQLITGLAMLLFNIFSIGYEDVPSWLQSAFGRVAAALDPAARALLVDTLVLARLPQTDLLDRIDDWLEAFSDSPKLLQSLAVLLMPIFPQIFDFDEESYDYLMELANPSSADLEVQQPADSTGPQEPDQKRSRLARSQGRDTKLLMATPPPLKREKAGDDVPVPSTPVRKAIRAPELLLATPAKSKREQTHQLPVTPPSLKRVRQTRLADEEPCLEKAPVTPDRPTTKLVPNAPERRKRRSDFMDEAFSLPEADWPAPVTPDHPTTKLVPNAPERRKRHSLFIDEAEMLPDAGWPATNGRP
ncbi:unnamed protein product [Symbiodinium sp. CCMP2456]|nr:unnamed protein product [Symbiodinium sp. CCMP2456]